MQRTVLTSLGSGEQMSNDTVTEVEMKESETGGRQSWDDPGSKEEEVGVNGS